MLGEGVYFLGKEKEEMLFCWLFGYFGVLFFIPVAVFMLTKIEENELDMEEIQPQTFWGKFLFCNGNINKMIRHDIILGWIFTFLIVVINELTVKKTGLSFLSVFLVYFPSQIYHYINLKTARQNRKKLKKVCLIFSIPDVYLLSLGIICSLPAHF